MAARKVLLYPDPRLKALSALSVSAAGFEARALLHELDHPNGLAFFDRVAPLIDDVLRRRSYA